MDQFSENHDRAAAASFGCKGSISRPGANSGIGTHEIDNDYTYRRPTTTTQRSISGSPAISRR